MMNRKLAVSLALALGMSATGASYAATPFSGPYVGAQVGYSVYDIKSTETDPTGTSTFDGLSGSGAEGGVYGGWGMKFGPNYYGGIEAEYNWSGADHTTTFPGGSLKIEDKDNWGISGRLGWLPSNNVMLYGRLGWQRVSLDTSGDVAGIGAGTISTDHDGFRLGVGTEVAMTSNWLVRADYNHTWYGEEDVAVGVKSEPDNDVFRVGIGYQF